MRDFVVEKEEFNVKPSTSALWWSGEGVLTLKELGSNPALTTYLTKCLTLPTLVSSVER